MSIHWYLFQLENFLRPLHLGSALKLQNLNSKLSRIQRFKNNNRGQQCYLVTMCTFNGERWVSAAIQSVLDQSYENWHLHITDDGSSDSTAKILAEFKKQLPDKISLELLEPNCFPQTTTNFSIRFFLQHKHFSIFTKLDQDDVAEPDWLLNCSKLLTGKIKVLRCKNARFNESLTDMKYVYPAASQIVAQREVIERVGERVDRNHPIVSDTEYLKRLERDAIANKYAIVLTPFLCQRMRVHGRNQTIVGTTKPV